MKKLFLIAILSVGIIGGAVLSPEIWAIVEPHITITMEPGQTTKPFVINDDTGNEVFSVDVDGTTTNDLTTFEYYEGSVQTFQGTYDNPHVFAKWRLTYSLDDTTDIQKLTIFQNGAVISGETRLLSGTEFVIVEFRTIEPISGEIEVNLGIGSDQPIFEFQGDVYFPGSLGFLLDDPHIDVELIGFSNDGLSVGEVRNLFASLNMRVPEFITVERLI